MGKEYIFLMRHTDEPRGEIWEEPMVISGSDPIAWVEEALKNFNSTLKSNERHRTFMGLKEEDGGSTYCELSKRNGMTLGDGLDTYDIMECSNCYFQIKRHGISSAGKVKCFPEQTCRSCNKIYKTEKGYQNHMNKDRHRRPVWCM